MNTVIIRAVAILIASVNFLLSTGIAGVFYPEITLGTRNVINSYRQADIFIGSERAEIWSNEYVVVTKSGRKGADIFRLTFKTVTDIPETGFKEPVFILVGGSYQEVAITQDASYWTYPDGTKEFYGTTYWGGQTLFIYSWSWRDGFGAEKWSANLCWGVGAGIDNQGTVIDRAQFGTIPGEDPENGFEMLAMGHDPSTQNSVIGIFYDAEAGFNLQFSNDCKSWKKIDFNFQDLPDANVWQDGVNFKGAALYPIEPSSTPPGTRGFFRLVRQD